MPFDRFPAIDFRSEGVLTRTESATICRGNLGTFTPCFRTFTSRSDFPCIHEARGLMRGEAMPTVTRRSSGERWSNADLLFLASALDQGMSVLLLSKIRVAPARAGVGKARRAPFRPQLNEPNRQLSVTSTRSAGCLARCVAGACFGTEGDRKRTGGHGQGYCTSR